VVKYTSLMTYTTPQCQFFVTVSWEDCGKLWNWWCARWWNFFCFFGCFPLNPVQKVEVSITIMTSRWRKSLLHRCVLHREVGLYSIFNLLKMLTSLTSDSTTTRTCKERWTMKRIEN
jgi:hypothetical protein